MKFKKERLNLIWTRICYSFRRYVKCCCVGQRKSNYSKESNHTHSEEGSRETLNLNTEALLYLGVRDCELWEKFMDELSKVKKKRSR